MQYLCESNITKNTLVSKVAGYRYVIDGASTTEANKNHAFLGDKGETPLLNLYHGMSIIHVIQDLEQ